MSLFGRIHGADDPLLAALEDCGVASVADLDAPLVVVASPPESVDDIEGALGGWIRLARVAAVHEQDVVTVVDGAMLYGDDVAAAAVGHGLVAAARAYAMEGARKGLSATTVVAGDPDRTARLVAFVLEHRVGAGDVLHVDEPPHGRQRP